MTGSISIVTFETGCEKSNSSIPVLLNSLMAAGIDADMLVFRNDKPLLQPENTKFKRILDAINTSSADYLLIVDNDITPSDRDIISFLKECPAETDLAWGTIGVTSYNSLIEKLIAVDKNLSHRIIRPFLWTIGVGISVPGQVMLMRRKTFVNLSEVGDTHFDDLTIGMFSRKMNFVTWRTNRCLGTEVPSSSFRILLKQRRRWGMGFRESWNLSKKYKMLRYCALHALAYHFLWAVILFINILLAFLIHPLCFVCSYLLLACVLSYGNPALFPPAVIYQLVFPFVHLIWFASFMMGNSKYQNDTTKRDVLVDN